MTETISILCVEDGSVDIEELEREGLQNGKILTYLKGSNPPHVLTLTKPKCIPIEKMVHNFDFETLMEAEEIGRETAAREILEWLVDHAFENAIIKTYFKEQFGVEVE